MDIFHNPQKINLADLIDVVIVSVCPSHPLFPGFVLKYLPVSSFLLLPLWSSRLSSSTPASNYLPAPGVPVCQPCVFILPCFPFPWLSLLPCVHCSPAFDSMVFDSGFLYSWLCPVCCCLACLDCLPAYDLRKLQENSVFLHQAQIYCIALRIAALPLHLRSEISC